MATDETRSSSNGSFIDAPDVAFLDDKEQKEAPLSTPVKHDANSDEVHPQPQEQEQPNSIVTVFDLATELETMLQKISKEVETNDEMIQEKINKITQKLDKIEGNIRTNSS